MTNMVKNAYMAHYIGNESELGNYISISEISFPEKEFALDLWFYILGESGTVLSQENGFFLGVSGEKAVLRLPGGRTVSTKSTLFSFKKRTWMNLYLGYASGKLVICLNGLPIGSFDNIPAFIQSGDIKVGEEFTGYIRSFRAYKFRLSEEDYKDYLYRTDYEATSMPDVFAVLDFATEKATDLTGGGATVVCHGNCMPMDLVDVYKPQDGRYITLPDSADANFGGFDTGEFSVYIKTYQRPCTKGHQVLVSNGEPGNADSVSVFSEEEGGTVSYGIRIAKERIVFQTDMKPWQWVDVIFCLKDKRVTAYINGKRYEQDIEPAEKKTSAGRVMIGGHSGSVNESSENYIHTVAIFDRVLSDGDATDFMENHPFVLEDGLRALVSFEGGAAVECFTGEELTANAEELFPAQQTFGNISDMQPYQYRVNYSAKSASQIKEWESRVITGGVSDFGMAALGMGALASEKLFEALITFVAHQKGLLADSKDLYLNAKVTSQDAAGGIAKMKPGHLRLLTRGMQLSAGAAALTGATAGTAAVQSAAVMDVAAKFLLILGAGAGIAVLAAKVIADSAQKKHIDRPDQDQDDDDDDDRDGEVKVKLLEITLQHAPDDYAVSAVRCRNKNGVIKGPEWTKEKKCINLAVYISDSVKRAKIKFKFRIEDTSKKPADSYTVSFKADAADTNQTMFDGMSYQKSGLVKDKDYEAEMTSAVEASYSKNIRFMQVKLWWNCEVNGESVLLPETSHDIYTIPTKPVPPILMDAECPNDLIAVEYLAIFAKLEEDAKPEMSDKGYSEVHSAEELINITNVLYNSALFRYEPSQPSSFIVDKTYIYNNKVVAHLKILDEKTLFEAMESASKAALIINMQCDGYACLLCQRFALAGIRCRLVYIYNPMTVSEHGAQEQLKVRDVVPAGHLTEPMRNLDFQAHMAVEVSPGREVNIDGNRIYDASMGHWMGDGVKAVAGMPFAGINATRVNRGSEAGTYRGTIIQDGTAAVISTDQYLFCRG